MRKYAPLLAATALSLTAFAPAPLPKPDPSKTELQKIQGTWVLTSYTLGGQAIAGFDGSEPLTVVIAGNRMRYLRGGRTVSEWEITLKARKKRIFDSRGVGHFEAMQYWGVYRLEGNTLTICSCRGASKTERPRSVSLHGPATLHIEVLKRKKR
jgi:uncharacterized protein (TIGR03067 family)